MAASVAYRSERFEVDANDPKDTMFLLGGVAMLLVGAGLVLSNKTVRAYLGDVNVGGLLQAAVPDLERYLRLRSM